MAPMSRPEAVVMKRLTALSRALPSATEGDTEALHEARVASRRLREALPVIVAAGRRQKKLRRKVRAITRLLGPVRELDVALANIKEIETARDVSRAATRQVRTLILAERRALQKTLRHELDSDSVARLRKRALQAVRKSTGPSAAAQALRRADAWKHAGERAMLLSDSVRHAGSMYLPDRLHEVRVAVKRLRYALETAGELERRRNIAGLIVLKQAQDLLGRMHDFEVLITRTRSVQSTAKISSLHESADLDRMVRRLEGDCRQLHAQYVGLRTVLVSTCDETVRRAERVVRRRRMS